MLNSHNLEQMADGTVVETHPFGAVLPSNATIMMMGTFPPTEDKWGMAFHYPNFYNDMWRIYGRVFFKDADHRGLDGDANKMFFFSNNRRGDILDAADSAGVVLANFPMFSEDGAVNRSGSVVFEKFLVWDS